MAFSQKFVIVDKIQHDLKKFSCGKADMDTYLARFAVKNMQLGLSRTWVLPIVNENPVTQKTPIAAYYSLASSTVNRESLPTNKSLPSYPVSVVLLARPALGVILDDLDEDVLRFYQHYDMFELFTDDPMRLFVPMNTLKQIPAVNRS